MTVKNAIHRTDTVLLQTTYVYDAQGHRVEQVQWQTGGATTVTRYAYDGDQVWAELSSGNAVQQRYVWGDQQTQLLARIDASGAVWWPLADHLGSVRDVVASSGAISDHIEYGAFGNITLETNAVVGGNILYTGLYQDRNVGTVTALGRTLLVTTGQWMQVDPIGFTGLDDNLRRYVENDPSNATDPLGLKGSGIKTITLKPFPDVPYSPLTATSWRDVRQGGLNDCWFIASLIALAYHRPQEINKMLEDWSLKGLYGGPKRREYKVRFPGKPATTVTGIISGGCQCKSGREVTKWSNVWPSVIEAAASEWIDLTTNRTLHLGDGTELLTGHHAKLLRGMSKLLYWSLVNKLFPIVPFKNVLIAGTGWTEPDAPGVVSEHVYSVLDLDRENHRVILRDPRGFSPDFNVVSPKRALSVVGTFWMTVPEMIRDFQGFSIEED